MSDTKSETIRFLATPEFKKNLENIAVNLKMSMSELIRASVNTYTGQRAKDVQDSFLKRAYDPKFKLFPTTMSTTEVRKRIASLLEESTFKSLELWSNPERVDDETFEEYLRTKIALSEKKAEAVTA